MWISARPRTHPRRWPAAAATAAALAGVLGAGALAAGAPLAAQTWQTWANSPSNGEFHDPGYPLVFVAAPIAEGQSSEHHGTDVRSASNPRGGNHLFVLKTDGTVVKLFPLPGHTLGAPALIDTLPGELAKGTVVEPNVSEDGRKIYFSYFHDSALPRTTQSGLPRLGADLYRMDLSGLLDGTIQDPSLLPVERLTQSHATPRVLAASDWAETAMNYQIAGSTSLNDWGTVYMHAVEMRKEGRLKLAYVTDERRLRGSNNPDFMEHNFNLHLADVPPPGPPRNYLENRRQFQYYTTTSALSPAPLRNGIAFSYQATTEDSRLWHLQSIDSAGRWYPLMGYGRGDFLFHLGALCVDDVAVKDYFIAALYYTGNNEGFGSLYRQDLAQAGRNFYPSQANQGVEPWQVGQVKITPTVPDLDAPSPLVGGRNVGKLAAPRCGRPRELYFAYSPTSANSREAQNGAIHVYHAMIGFRPNFDAFDPLQPYGSPAGIKKVVVDGSNAYSLVWPTPILPWSARTGDAVQRSAPAILKGPTGIAAGLPWARVGTSALYNTDRRPYDCWLRFWGSTINTTPYNPNKITLEQRKKMVQPSDGLTVVQDPQAPCQPLDPARVLGIAVQITSNQTDTWIGFSPAYETDLGRLSSTGEPGELVKLLGVYDVRGSGLVSPGQPQPFLATIPAHTPFELQLLDRAYGLKLVDVRSWHSLQPRETRSDCGGCHNHAPGGAIPYTSTPPALDLVSSTPHLYYDAWCRPVLVPSTAPSLAMPEWKADVWPGIAAHCSGCHTDSANPAYAAWGYAGEQDAYRQLLQRHYADSRLGALGSPAFWAAYGGRTDGRDNTDPHFAKNLSVNPVQWSFRYSAAHDALDLCSGTAPDAAQWVYRLGQWIDNHLPRNRSTSPGAKNAGFDFYHPAVDLAVIDTTCQPDLLRAGWWDDGGQLAQVTVTRVADQALLASWSGVPNGSGTFDPAAAGHPLAPQDVLRIVARDSTGNRQMYEKRVSELIEDCQRSLPQPVDEDTAPVFPGP